jgi:hypothetical protein
MHEQPELISGHNGRWLGKRGIFRHYVPHVDGVHPSEWPGEMAFHVMVTAVAEWAPTMVGELIRVMYDDVVSFEVRINGTDDDAGICDVAAFSVDSLAALAKIANDLRYEWEIITGVYPDVKWDVW